LQKALDLIARRPHFRRELEHKLSQRGFDSSEIESAVSELAERGWIDDLSNAREMAAGPFARKNLGPRRISYELQRRGVDQETVQLIVKEVFSEPEEELERARRVAQRVSHGTEIDRQRLARMLDRKGFSKAVIVTVLGESGTD